MSSFFILLFILYFEYPIPSYAVFSMQQTLTILCQQFPLVSNVNDSDLQCARLRMDENIPITEFDLDRPTQIILFIIIDQSSSDLSPIDIIINFNQSSNSPSSINEIRLSLLVTHSNFTINNQTTTIFTSYNIPIFLWQNSPQNTFDLIDLLQLEKNEYRTDTSLCTWNSDRWNRLFNGNMSNNVSYVYFLKTTNPQLTFTLIDTNDKSSLPSPPSPYLNILFCVPYKLGITEIILIVCFGAFFIIILIILCILHYLKGGEDNRTRHFERYHNRGTQDNFVKHHSKKVRHHSSASISSVEQDDQISD